MLPELLLKKGLMAIGGFTAPVMKSRLVFLANKGHKGNPVQRLYSLVSTKPGSSYRVRAFAVRTGSVGSGFKLIFQFQDSGGQAISYIKVGDPVYRVAFLCNEKKILEYLETVGDVVLSPKVIGYKEQESFSAIEISAMKKARYFPRPNYRRVAVLLANLCRKSAYEGSLENGKKAGGRVVRYLEKQRTRDFVNNTIDYLSSHSYPRPLCHRDLAGWNVFSCEGGRLGILDWEFGKESHLPFQDLFHYLLHTKMHNSRLSPVEAYRHVFERDRKVREAVDIYGRMMGITDAELRKHLMVGYLWDWYSLERSREERGEMQGGEYLEILDWLAGKEKRLTTKNTKVTKNGI